MGKVKSMAVRKESAVEGEHVHLNDRQELLLDLAGDMIINGAAQADADRLLVALIAFWWHRRFPEDSRSYLRTDGVEFARHHLAKWREEWMRNCPKRESRPTEPMPKAITDKIRRNMREELRREFDDFMGDAAPEEIVLMRDILLDRQSISGNELDQIWLADAFSIAIRRRTNYVRVPDDLVEVIQAQVTAFEKRGAA